MAMVIAKGIPTGSPVTDAAAVWTPPHVGPLDGASMWLAHSLRGTVTPGSGAVTRLSDMIGGTDLTGTGTTSNTTFTDDGGALPYITLKDGYAKLSGTITAAANTDDRTVLVVARPNTTTRTSNVVVPGWGNVNLNGGKVTVGSVSASITSTAWQIIALRYKAAGTCDVYVGGALVGQATGLTKSTTALTWAIGGYQTSTANEDYALVKSWPRALSAAEITSATSDAKALLAIA